MNYRQMVRGRRAKCSTWKEASKALTSRTRSSGSEFGNINNIDGKFYLIVHNTATGKLLRKSEFKYGSVERLGWRFGSVESIGWMPDDKRIFFTIDLAGDSDDA
jgi:hypothetical protein